ncbi:MAG: hypothetical protein ACFE8N_14910 [Promethearchaeota archaeon]
MDYTETFYEMLQFLQKSYKKFPKFMIEIMAENYDIPSEEIKPLFQMFRRKGILHIIKEEGYTYKLNKVLKD